MLDFVTTVRTRQSIRQFLPQEIPQSVLDEVVKDAMHAPSSCNTQPWHVHIVSGEKLEKLSTLLLENFEKQDFSMETHFDQNYYKGDMETRWRKQYKFVYDGFGVARSDKAGRTRITRRNFEFYGAKHLAILCVPKVAGNEEVIAGDMAMFAQNMMLSLTARGYGSIPLLSVGMFGGAIREFLGVSDDYKMLWAVALGVPDWNATPNKQHVGRVDVNDIVKFHR